MTVIDHRRGSRLALSAAVPSLALALLAAPPVSADEPGGSSPRTVLGGLDAPRGLAVDGGRTYVSEADGTVTEVRHDGRRVRTTVIGTVPAGFVAPAVAAGRGNRVWALTPEGPPGTGAATLYLLEEGEPAKVVRDIAAYQAGDPDPYNLAEDPGQSNPFGLAALPDGGVLVADAANNDLLEVTRKGEITTVARLKPRTVPAPEGLPPGAPPPGTMMPSEPVATSVTVGSDGYYYVGELRGFPGTPGFSQVWRIRPGSVGAVCDPDAPDTGPCRRYADGLTSIVDLGAGPRRAIYVAQLADAGWFQVEFGSPPDVEGSIIRIDRSGDQTELAPGAFSLPGGVEVGRRGQVLVTGPSLPVGPGALYELHAPR